MFHPECGQEPQNFVQRIFEKVGSVTVIKEEQCRPATVISSCQQALLLKYVQAAKEAGIKMGLTRQQVLSLTRQVMLGVADMLDEDMNLDLEIDKVCTPGGMTIKGVTAMETEGVVGGLVKSFLACNQ